MTNNEEKITSRFISKSGNRYIIKTTGSGKEWKTEAFLVIEKDIVSQFYDSPFLDKDQVQKIGSTIFTKSRDEAIDAHSDACEEWKRRG